MGTEKNINNLNILPKMREIKTITPITKKKKQQTSSKFPRYTSSIPSNFKLCERGKKPQDCQSMISKSQLFPVPGNSALQTKSMKNILPRKYEIQTHKISKLIDEHISQVTAKECQENSRKTHSHIKNYVDRRMIKISTFSNIISNKKQKHFETSFLDFMPPLHFSKEVLKSRGCSVLLPFDPEARNKHIYSSKLISTSEGKNETKSIGRKTSKNIYTGKNLIRHKGCLFQSDRSRNIIIMASKPRFRVNGTPNKIKNEKRRSANVTEHLWEKQALGLVSKNTAQWIVSRCTEGREQEKLASFLDNKYGSKGETMAVRKLLDINDDCLVKLMRKV